MSIQGSINSALGTVSQVRVQKALKDIGEGVKKTAENTGEAIERWNKEHPTYLEDAVKEEAKQVTKGDNELTNAYFRGQQFFRDKQMEARTNRDQRGQDVARGLKGGNPLGDNQEYKQAMRQAENKYFQRLYETQMNKAAAEQMKELAAGSKNEYGLNVIYGNGGKK